ncbi:MAG: FeoB-associated Cys-rich membrane protein [Proteobacteria bacterium]|nr:FeoB-associated Cys-rich membrane protein [Desulfobulbaceae bacterium]MBU4153777.1 FeoB-associated Cys-rich membrane protein [Pseudomonadota bacterium]
MQTVLVWIIVIAAAYYLVRKYYRTLSGKDQQGCDCGSGCDSCSSVNKEKLCEFPNNNSHKTDTK